jgi:hypothetical protein
MKKSRLVTMTPSSKRFSIQDISKRMIAALAKKAHGSAEEGRR